MYTSFYNTSNKTLQSTNSTKSHHQTTEIIIEIIRNSLINHLTWFVFDSRRIYGFYSPNPLKLGRYPTPAANTCSTGRRVKNNFLGQTTQTCSTSFDCHLEIVVCFYFRFQFFFSTAKTGYCAELSDNFIFISIVSSDDCLCT